MRIYILLIILLGSLLNACAQIQMNYSTKSKKAIKLFEKARNAPSQFADENTGQPNYSEGIKLLQQAVGKAPAFWEAQLLMGEFYEYNNDYPSAIKQYEISLALNPMHSSSGATFCYLANLHLAMGNYAESIKYCNIFFKNPNASQRLSPQVYLMKRNAEFAIHALANPKEFNPVNLGPEINTARPEYYPALTVDGQTLLFTRLLESKNVDFKEQEDFFVSNKNASGNWNTSIPMPRNINTSNNEGAPTLSADGRSLVFVACADQTGYYGPNRQGRGSCDLFYAKKIGRKWYGPINLPGYVNSSNWESQPSLSADGKTLYFVRGRKGDRSNNSDIYVSELQEDGSWGTAKALPDYINTPNTEESVHIHPDGRTLYFASKGHPGMGGSDLYVTRKDVNGKWSIPENLGYPINTKYDENSLMVSAEGEIAYFASDREGGFGDLDIYSFILPKESRAIRTVYFDGFVFDKESKAPLPGKFELFDVSNGQVIIVSEADEVTGTFMVPLPLDRNYVVSVSHEGYHPFSLNFDLSNNQSADSYHVDIPMTRPIIVAKDTHKLTHEHIFKNVFFDLNKSTLRKESRIELNLFAEYLKKNIEIKIELGGHTDSRGNEESNISLSKARAGAVFEFLVSKGISPQRMTFVGYGSSKPIYTEEQIKNIPEAIEKEAAHQQNRRTVWRERL